MKKLLALSLAVVMVLAVSVTAFAWNVDKHQETLHGDPGDAIEVEYSDFLNMNAAYAALPTTDANYQKYDNFDAAISQGVKVGDYTISKSGMPTAVDTVVFDTDENVVKIKIKQNYTLEIKNLIGSVTLKPKSVVSGHPRYEYKVSFGATQAIGTIGSTPHTLEATYGYVVMEMTDDSDLTFNYDSVATYDNFIVKMRTGTAQISFGALGGNSQYNDPDLYATFKVNSSNKKVFLGYNTSTIKAVYDTYESAALNFITFPAAPDLGASATLRYFADEEIFVYEYKDGKLTQLKTTADDDEESWSFTVRYLGAYVFSDVELDVSLMGGTTSSQSDTTPNPDTGANDFVNVAVALAVVSLAAAGAVVLKKK